MLPQLRNDNYQIVIKVYKALLAEHADRLGDPVDKGYRARQRCYIYPLIFWQGQVKYQLNNFFQKLFFL